MENKNLPTIRQSTEVALARANTLMDVVDKILAKQSTDLVDESWMEILWKWAYDIGEGVDVGYEGDAPHSRSFFPRDREGLVKINHLYIGCSEVVYTTTLPKEIGNLVNLTKLQICFTPNLIELPKEIGDLVNLIKLRIIYPRQLFDLPKEIVKLVGLNLTSIKLNHKECIDVFSINRGNTISPAE